MAYIAVDDNGTAYLYMEKPFRTEHGTWDVEPRTGYAGWAQLEEGSILQLIGREMQPYEEPIEI